jgi:hypothetical protein
MSSVIAKQSMVDYLRDNPLFAVMAAGFGVAVQYIEKLPFLSINMSVFGELLFAFKVLSIVFGAFVAFITFIIKAVELWEIIETKMKKRKK